MYFKKFLFILFVISSAVFAQVEEFNEYFYSNELSSRHCGRNTSNFIDYLDESGYSISQIDTLVITAPGNGWSFGKVLAVNSRWGKEVNGVYHENWQFHVVSIIDGYVYDFSFNKTPLILTLKDYLDSMFIPKNSFMPYGPDFRTSGHGPWFNKKEARDVFKDYRFDILNTQNNGNLSKTYSGLDSQQLLNLYN